MKFFIDNWFLFFAALSSGALLLWPMLKGGAGGSGKVTAAEAVRLINRERAVLIDVSDAADYAAGHAIGARSIPLAGLETSTDLPKNKTLPLVVMCPSGSRSGRAVATLRKLGFEQACALAGGLSAWRAASLPVERKA